MIPQNTTQAHPEYPHILSGVRYSRQLTQRLRFQVTRDWFFIITSTSAAYHSANISSETIEAPRQMRAHCHQRQKSRRSSLVTGGTPLSSTSKRLQPLPKLRRMLTARCRCVTLATCVQMT